MMVYVLAAGQGTRLQHLTHNNPKCLVPLLGISLLDRQMSLFKKSGLKDVIVIGGHCFNKIKDTGYRCYEYTAYAETNMVATFFSALDATYVRGEDVLISYGDIVYQPSNLQTVLKHDYPTGVMVDMGWESYWKMRFSDPLEDAESMCIDNEFITSLGEKVSSISSIQGQYTGLMKISAHDIDIWRKIYRLCDRDKDYGGMNFQNMYMTDFLNLIIRQGHKVASIPVCHGWLEVDTLNDLKIYHDLAQGGMLDQWCVLDACSIKC